MYTCPKCEREILSKGGLTQHLKFCKGKRVCANPDCNNFIKPNNQYCSNRCAALVTSPGRTHSTETRQKISCTLGGSGELRSLGNGKCISCGKNTKNQKFCNSQCAADYRYKEFIKNWLSGKDNGVRNKTGTCAYIKRWLIEKYGEKCMQCGWNKKHPITHRVPIQLDHSNGDFTNNDLTNLKLLCPNCHSLTLYFGALNYGNGRTIRPRSSTWSEHSPYKGKMEVQIFTRTSI